MSSRPNQKKKGFQKSSFSKKKEYEANARFESSRKGFNNNHSSKEKTQSVIAVENIPDCNDEELVKLLRQKHGKSFAYRTITYDGDRAYITLTNSHDAFQLSKLREVDFKGKRVKISVFSGDPANIVTPKKFETLCQFILSRVNRESKVLDLSKIKGIETLKEHGISVDLNNVPFMASLFRAVKNIYPEVNAIDFSENEIKELGIFKNITFFLPKITTMYFSKNLIKDIKTLEALKELRLLEASFQGNPFEENRDKKDYIKIVLEKLKTVRVLDKSAVETPPQLIKMLSSKGNFNFPDDTQTIVNHFLLNYHSAFQDSRELIGDAYHENAMMTFFITSNDKNRPIISNLFADYPVNRNLNTEKSISEKIEMVQYGKSSIVKFLTELPAVYFIFQSFIYDSVVEKLDTDFMVLSLHGFLEVKDERMSFDRTFLLVPSSTSLGVMIVNDMMNLHPFTGKSIVPVREERELNSL